MWKYVIFLCATQCFVREVQNIYVRRILVIGSGQQTQWLLTGHYVKMEEGRVGWGYESKMAVAPGVMCLGGVGRASVCSWYVTLCRK